MRTAPRAARIEWQGVRIPFRQPFVTSEGSSSFRYALLLTVHTADMIAGCGEAGVVGPGSPASLRGLDLLMRRIAPQLVGMPLGALPTRADALTKGNPLARALCFGIETAAYDALGKVKEIPVARMLGGNPRSVRVNATLGLDSPIKTTRRARQAVAEGFTTIKLKLSGDRTRDASTLRAVRAAVGRGIRLRLDPNQAWDAAAAVAALACLKAFGVEYVEQPVAADDLVGLLRVQRESGLPVAADEAMTSLSRARRLLDAAAVDVLVVKAARLGGLRKAAAVLRLAQRRGVPAVVTSSLETGIGIAASLHLAALTDPRGPASGLATGALLESDLLVTPLLAHKGLIRVPVGPGLGVQVDHAALRRYRAGPAGSLAAS